nr:hypothetical protein [Pseudomonas sp. Y24-6]
MEGAFPSSEHRIDPVGRELLKLVTELRESKAHPSLDKVFEHMQDELSTSIDIIENPPTWGPWCQ